MELLVVISVITLLISLLLPALQKSRKTARASICLSNLRQLQIAQIAYADDFEGNVKNLSASAGEYWHHALGKYLGAPEYKANPNLAHWKQGPMSVLNCPEVTQNAKGGFGGATIPWRYQGEGSYGANLWVFPRYVQYDNDWRFPRGHFYSKLEAVDRPSHVPIYGDSNWIGSWPDSVDTVPPSLFWGYAVHEIGYFMGRYTIDRHDHTMQMVYVDSSARRISISELWQQHWHRDYQPVEMAVP